MDAGKLLFEGKLNVYFKLTRVRTVQMVHKRQGCKSMFNFGGVFW